MIEWCKELCEESETVPEAVMIIECGSWSLPKPCLLPICNRLRLVIFVAFGESYPVGARKGRHPLDSDQTALGHPARSVRAWRLSRGKFLRLRPPQATRCFEELRVSQCQNDLPGPEED